MRNFVHCIGSTRRSVRKQRNQQGESTADDQRRRNIEDDRQVLLQSVEVAFATRKGSGCTRFLLERHPIFVGTTTQAVTSLMLDLCFILHAELRTDGTAATGSASRRGAGQERHTHCKGLSLQHTIARRTIRTEKQAGSTLSARVGSEAGTPAPKM